MAQELIAHGAHKVYVYDDEKLANYNTTAYSKVLCDFFHEVKPNVFLVGATNIGRDLGPRVANSLKTGLTADCTGLSVDEDGKTIVWTRPALGGNIMAEIICPDNRPQMGTVRPNVFKKPEADPSATGEVIEMEAKLSDADFMTKFVELIKMGGEGVKIEEADAIVAGGRGMHGAEPYVDGGILQELAALPAHPVQLLSLAGSTLSIRLARQVRLLARNSTSLALFPVLFSTWQA